MQDAKAFIVEHSTNYVHVVEANNGESKALAIIRYLNQLWKWTKQCPANLITVSPVINFNNPTDPIVRYCHEKQIRIISSVPLIRFPRQDRSVCSHISTND